MEPEMVTRIYTHELKKRIQAIAGWYELEEEGKLQIHGKEVLYVLGIAAVDSSCCGVWGCRYGLVPGYIRHFKTRKDAEGCWISEVEPIADEKARQEISRILKEKEGVQQVRFS